jgi:hypothetical protein
MSTVTHPQWISTCSRRRLIALFAAGLGSLLVGPFAKAAETGAGPFVYGPFVYGKDIDGRDLTSLGRAHNQIHRRHLRSRRLPYL